eukprot:CAMPEP_0185845482 /NCGR_PEP_ID=MMETSP1354-20130828/1449_1 /TAXON_ID=708628 /ORGANISM="Erythrolobus madagascarensis, Strain CCMP3276" /LENGTH=133 /DNA_ID=CAMNT_0028545461 /DNA_START=300 /DNA_END=701 /DNA_ORIENTATION=-
MASGRRQPASSSLKFATVRDPSELDDGFDSFVGSVRSSRTSLSPTQSKSSSSVVRRSRAPEEVLSDAQRAFAMYKPAWFQPYTMIPLGLLMIALTWTMMGSMPAVIVTTVVSFWWYVFLVEYPRFVLGQVDEE